MNRITILEIRPEFSFHPVHNLLCYPHGSNDGRQNERVKMEYFIGQIIADILELVAVSIYRKWFQKKNQE